MGAAVDPLGDENQRLRHCINDLVSILAVPAMWAGASPSQIVRTLLDALLAMLKLDIIYFSLADGGEAGPMEIVRLAETWHPTLSLQDASQILRQSLGEHSQKQALASSHRLGNTDISTASFPLGLRGEVGLIVAGSRRADFPKLTERLILNVAANQAAMGLHSANILDQQKHLADELERRVAERTAELAETNKDLAESQTALVKAFEDIAKSEAKLRQVIDALPALAWCNLPDGSNEFLSKGWHDYTGLSPEASYGWGWGAAFHEQDLPSLMEKWQAMLISGEPGEIEARLRRHDGVFRWFLIRAQPFRDRTGAIVRWYGTSTDIEDRKRAEEALRDSEQSSRLVLDGIAGLVAIMSPKGQVKAVNRQALDYFGKSVEELKTWSTTDAVHPEDLPRVTSTWSRSVETADAYDVDHRLRGRDGAYRWFHARGLPLRDDKGHIVRWYVLLTDIDDRRRVEEALQASERELDSIVNTIPALAWSARPDGSAEFFNQHYLAYVGLPLGKLQGSGWTVAVHPDDLGTLVAAWQSMLASGKGGEVEARLRRFDGDYRWFLFRTNPVLGESGAIVKWYGTNTDIDDRKRAEEELHNTQAEFGRVMRAMTMGQLTASIAHEVNQPLSGIVTNASTCLRMLDAQPPNLEGARETARRTIRDGNRASDVITRLRTLYSKKEPALESMDLNEATREVITLSLSELQRKGVILRQELANNLPPAVGDRVQLQQVILNLLRNAADAMSTVDDRPRELLIRTESDNESQIRLSVKDSGVGFAPHTAHKIFETFYTTKTDGMGVGLSISRSIIEAHQGRIWATANDGPGCTFSFAVPRAIETFS
jgi:PAS domain S-box-containing protein